MPYPYDLGNVPPEAPRNLYVEPTSFTAGDTLSFRKRFALYRPSDGWVLAYSMLVVDGSGDPSFTASADGEDFFVEVPPTTTRLWPPGKYAIQGYVINSSTGERHTVYDNWIDIARALDATLLQTDLRTHAQRMLDYIRATLEGRAQDDILDSHIGDTTFRRLTPEQLMFLKDRYEIEVRKEIAQARVKAGLASGRKHYARLVRAM